ncbi:MAG TPA: diguanylate cyclase [Natronincola sp.]|nr:diguanylate cyclase [Natronincola sp.]
MKATDHVLSSMITDALFEGYIMVRSLITKGEDASTSYLIREINKQAKEIFEVTKEKVATKQVEELFAVYDGLWEKTTNYLDNLSDFSELEYNCTRTGKSMLLRLVKISDDEVTIFVQDITLQLQAEDIADIHQVLLDNIHDIILYFDMNGRVVNANARACEEYGYTKEQLLEISLEDIYGDTNLEEINTQLGLHESKRMIFDSIHSRLDGSRFPVQVTVRNIKTGAGQLSMHIISDLTESKKQEVKIAWLARHDDLTGISNRASFFRQLEIELERATRERSKAAILLLDLDRFSLINDDYGYNAGDFVLKHLAARIKSILRQTDYMGRMGDDKFIILQTNVRVKADVISLAERISTVFKKPIFYKGQMVQVSASIGISLFPEDTRMPSELMHLVSQAVDSRKKLGGNGYTFSHNN